MPNVYHVALPSDEPQHSEAQNVSDKCVFGEDQYKATQSSNGVDEPVEFISCQAIFELAYQKDHR